MLALKATLRKLFFCQHKSECWVLSRDSMSRYYYYSFTCFFFFGVDAHRPRIGISWSVLILLSLDQSWYHWVVFTEDTVDLLWSAATPDLPPRRCGSPYSLRLRFSRGWTFMIGVTVTSDSAESWITLGWRGMRRRTGWPKRSLVLLSFSVEPCQGGTTYLRLVIKFGCWGRLVGRSCPRNENESNSRTNGTLSLLPMDRASGR